MKYIANIIFVFIVASSCYAGLQGRGYGHEEEDHNCIALIQEGGVVFDDLHGHVNEGQVANWHHYSVLILQGVSDLHLQNSGGSGDADLYTLKNDIPTLNNWDCRPYHDGNDEGCTSNDLTSGDDYYFSLNAASTDYSGSDLVVNYNLPNDGNINRIEGFGWPANSYPMGTMKYFMIHVPVGLENLEITSSGGTGDVDLYLKRGISENISTKNNDLYSIGSGNSERIFQPAPISGIYTIGLYAHDSFSNVHLKVRYSAYNPGAASAVNDIPIPLSRPLIESLNNKQWLPFYHGATHYFHVDASGDLPWLHVAGYHRDGDMDLYVARDKIPTTSDYDCRSINSGFMVNGVDDGFGYDNKHYEDCKVPVDRAARYYIMVNSYKQRYYTRGSVKALFYSSDTKYIDTGSMIDAASKTAWFIPNSCGTQAAGISYSGDTRDYTLLNSHAAEETICIPGSLKNTVSRNFLIRVSSEFSLTVKTDHGTGNGDLYMAATDSSYLTTLSFKENKLIKAKYTRKSINSNNRECIEISSSNYNSLFVRIKYVGKHSGATLYVAKNDPNGCDDFVETF